MVEGFEEPTVEIDDEPVTDALDEVDNLATALDELPDETRLVLNTNFTAELRKLGRIDQMMRTLPGVVVGDLESEQHQRGDR